MLKIGNKRANQYFEDRMEKDFRRPSWNGNDDVEEFIRDKYVNKRWAKVKECAEVEKEKKEQIKTRVELPTFDLIPLV